MWQVHNPVNYVKSIILGKIARGLQILGEGASWSIFYQVTNFLTGLAEDDKGYSWRILYKAVAGNRKEWARPITSLPRSFIRLVIPKRRQKPQLPYA